VGHAELMRDIEIPYATFEQDDYILVVIEATAKYHTNVGYDSLATVKNRISDLIAVRVRFEYEIVDENRELPIDGYTVHASLKTYSKPIKIPADLREIMAQNLKP
jgi:acyl-CoA thioester hydrolase